ncbi:hypothetical protein BGC30_12980 [Novacetimonas hansenii]|nr:hypothetical protein BGC30_12980 [Novacetimonas hansenii]
MIRLHLWQDAGDQGTDQPALPSKKQENRPSPSGLPPQPTTVAGIAATQFLQWRHGTYDAGTHDCEAILHPTMALPPEKELQGAGFSVQMLHGYEGLSPSSQEMEKSHGMEYTQDH